MQGDEDFDVLNKIIVNFLALEGKGCWCFS